MLRVGIGYDIHKLSASRKLVLGGVNIRSSKGGLGHSDADVLLHALCDALLGAAGEADIGTHFPPDDDRFEDISSLKLLKKVCSILEAKSFIVSNVDCMLLLETPRIAPYRKEMIAKIAKALKIKKACVSVKATTNEGVGPIGEGTATAAYAVAMIEKKRKRRKRSSR